ncbi:glycosyltransferase [Flammeovirga pectinis]|uniref:Glycosyltransferase n=1 Tax=Flammeovirga pectinis TaxID=2494373 RepID=A0A3S9P5W1_9BACT|nr:glycosyltransferase [Flammeovirga pectinis]AZQ63568.1 glycosyltransferase [Flammeovirga pectinis]
MKKQKVLLISEQILHYRASLYNEFNSLFEENNIELDVVSDKDNKSDYKLKFQFEKLPYKVNKVTNLIKRRSPDIVILFWNIYNINTWLITLYLKSNRIPFIYWTHGISMTNPHSWIKQIPYKLMHNLSDSIVLYSKNELKYIEDKNISKTFIANNTINFNDIPKLTSSKNELKVKYNIPFENVVLFVGRIQNRKRLDILIDIFVNEQLNNDDTCLVIVGNNMPSYLNDKVKSSNRIYNLGPIYDTIAINQIFKMSDVFCIPGTNGLGVNQAMYWGLPIFTLNVNHSPEIVYVKEGETGFICNNQSDLVTKLNEILDDEKQIKKMSIYCSKYIKEEASVEVMFRGFLNAISFLNESK